MELSALTVTPELVRCAIASLQCKWSPHSLYHHRAPVHADRLNDPQACQALIEHVVRIFDGGAYVPEAAETEHIAVAVAHKVKPMLRLSLLDAVVHETAYLATYPAIREYINDLSPHSDGQTLVFPSAQDCGLVEPYTEFKPEILWALQSPMPTKQTRSKTITYPYGYTCDMRQCSESILITRLIQQLRELGIANTILQPLETLWRAHSVTGDTGLPYNFDAATWGWLNLYFLPIDRQFKQLGLKPKRSYDAYYFPLEHPHQLRGLLKTIAPILAAANFHINPNQSFLFANGHGLSFYFRQFRLTCDLLLSGYKAWVVGSALYCTGFRFAWLERHLLHIIKMDCPRRLTWLCGDVTPARWKSIARLCERFFDETAQEEPCLGFMLWQTLQVSTAAPYSRELVAQWAHLNR